MSHEAILGIYRNVLKYNYAFQYLEEDRYFLVKYRKNGEKRWQGYYKDEYFDGDMYWWGEKGTLRRTMVWKNGDLISEKCIEEDI